jgi:aconitate hydratase
MANEAFDTAVAAARRTRELEAGGIVRRIVDVSGIPGALRIPQAHVRLLENVVRRAATDEEACVQARRVIEAGLSGTSGAEVDFWPARVLFQDFTGVPIFVDFAAMRDAMVERGGDPRAVNPRIPCTLVIDHSVAADVVDAPDAADKNLEIERRRNRERFQFLKWSSKSFDNVQIVPPGQGICHQLNVEKFCKVVATDALWEGEGELACFDTLVGSDSHTPTANGIGVLGWGVGGIEAEAAALGQPLPMLVPEVVGLHVTGELPCFASAMDVALACAKTLRAEGVVGAIVEAYGPGVENLTVTQRACISNMTPEYGATATLFPIDNRVLEYLALTGRDEAEIAFVEAYARKQGAFGQESEARVYARTVELDLSSIEPSLAGPSRPHDRVSIHGLPERVAASCEAHGHGDMTEKFAVECEDGAHELSHGAIAIAAITSCTTATDPAMLVAAGLVAKKANALGLSPKPWVKRVFAPGSHAAALVLERAGLLGELERAGFSLCGYGCMSCIGNSGEIFDCLKPRASEMELASVLSGNRNFDGRINPDVSQNYLCQPALVVAYSFAGTMDIDLTTQPVGEGTDGPVMLSDLMPAADEVAAVLSSSLDASVYVEGMEGLLAGDAAWNALACEEGTTYAWDPESTYIRKPPYFEIARTGEKIGVEGARVLVFAPDFVTTDHISPAGAIAKDSPAATYLRERGVADADFNTYGSRRGNHEVMERGTFANVKLENKLAEGLRGCHTRDLLTGEMTSVWGAAEDYMDHATDTVVLAGKMYGSGSSRDWAAKGPVLQGVRAVIAESFERIHRSNLVGMGILPLEFLDGQSAESLGLTGRESFTIEPVDVSGGLPASPTTRVRATTPAGDVVEFDVRVRIDTPKEGFYMAQGGILPYVLNEIAAN